MNANWIDTGETITYRCGHTTPHMVNKYWTRAHRAQRAPSARDYNCAECHKDHAFTDEAAAIARELVGRFTEEELERWIADPEGFLRSEGLLMERESREPVVMEVLGLFAQMVLIFQREQPKPAA
jgi:hypothetical protein